MLKSLLQMVNRGPDPEGRGEHERYFDVLRAMLFYIDEFPEKPCITPRNRSCCFRAWPRPRQTPAELIDQLDRDHHARREPGARTHAPADGLGAPGRFPAGRLSTTRSTRYVDFYLEHMRQEEMVILPEAERALTDADWHALNAAFATNQDPLNTPPAARPAVRPPVHPHRDARAFAGRVWAAEGQGLNARP